MDNPSHFLNDDPVLLALTRLTLEALASEEAETFLGHALREVWQ